MCVCVYNISNWKKRKTCKTIYKKHKTIPIRSIAHLVLCCTTEWLFVALQCGLRYSGVGSREVALKKIYCECKIQSRCQEGDIWLAADNWLYKQMHLWISLHQGTFKSLKMQIQLFLYMLMSQHICFDEIAVLIVVIFNTNFCVYIRNIYSWTFWIWLNFKRRMMCVLVFVCAATEVQSTNKLTNDKFSWKPWERFKKKSIGEIWYPQKRHTEVEISCVSYMTQEAEQI